MVRMVQETFYAIQHDAKARAMNGLNDGAQVMQQRLYLAPVYVAVDGILEDGVDQVFVFVAHDEIRSFVQCGQNT